MNESLQLDVRPAASEPPPIELFVRGVRVRLERRIGAGRYGTVHAGRDEWGEALAVKLYKPFVPDDVWQNELRQLERFRHANVVELCGGARRGKERYAILRYAGKPLAQLRDSRSTESRERFVLHVARGLLQALHELHSAGYVHGDVNPGNCLVQQVGPSVHVRLADFAFCRRVEDPEPELARYAAWMPLPERFGPRRTRTGIKADVYLAALLLLERLIGTPLDRDHVQLRFRVLPKYLVDRGRPIVQALAAALSPEPWRRPGALELWRQLCQAAKPFEPASRA